MAEEQVTEEIIEETLQETPEEVKDRTTKEFEKLTKNNQVLKEERDQYKNLFESLRPADVTPEDKQEIKTHFPNVNQEQVDKTLAAVVDENGYLDGGKLAQTLQALEDKAKRAEQAVEALKTAEAKKIADNRDKEEKQAMQDVYDKFPQLNPENIEGVEKDGQTIKFDPKMWQYVYNELTAKAKKGQMPSETDYMNAANQVYTDLYEGRDMTNKEQIQQEKTEDQKRQINATRPRSTIHMGHYEGQDDTELVQQVRAGKRGAVGALLRKRGL